MSNAILPHTLAVFAVGIIVRWYTVRTYDPYMTPRNYVQEEWTITKSGHP